LRHTAIWNTGLKLILNTPGAEPKTFSRRHGLMDLVMEDLSSDGAEPLYLRRLHYSGKTLEFASRHSNSRYGETFFSFVNGQYTSDGGTHLSAFREGLLKAVNEYCNGKVRGRRRREAMVRCGGDPFERPDVRIANEEQTRNTEIRTELVKQRARELLHFFQATNRSPRTIMAKVKDNAGIAERIAKNVKKLARERAKAITLRIPPIEGLQKSFRQEEGKKAKKRWCHLRRPVRRRLDHELPRREQSGGVVVEGQAAQRLGSQARRDV